MANRAGSDHLSHEADALGLRAGPALLSDGFGRLWVARGLRIKMSELPATTLADFRAEARVVPEFNNCSPGCERARNDDAMACRLANILFGVSSVWRDDDDLVGRGT
jgi:hypothetical protein